MRPFLHQKVDYPKIKDVLRLHAAAPHLAKKSVIPTHPLAAQEVYFLHALKIQRAWLLTPAACRF